MKALYYWIIVFVFVLFSTIIGLFLFPFIHWLFNLSELYIVLFCLGGVLLVSSLIFFLKRKKKFNKIGAMIMFPIALFFTISGIIHLNRFGNYTNSFNSYLKYDNVIYSKFGVVLCDGYGSNWVIGNDGYGNKLLVNYIYQSECVGKKDVYDRDSQGDILVSSYSGDLLERECDLEKVTYTISIYDKYGDYYSSVNGTYYYTYNIQSDPNYRYEYYETLTDNKLGKYSNQIIHQEIREALSQNGISVSLY